MREYPPTANLKLGHKYTGPWIVMGMVDTHNVEICRGRNPIIVHVQALKPYYVQTNDGSRTMAEEQEKLTLEGKASICHWAGTGGMNDNE